MHTYRKILIPFATIASLLYLSIVFSIVPPRDVTLWVLIGVFGAIGLLGGMAMHMGLKFFRSGLDYRKNIIISIIFGLSCAVSVVLLWANALNVGAALLIALLLLILSWYLQKRSGA